MRTEFEKVEEWRGYEEEVGGWNKHSRELRKDFHTHVIRYYDIG